MRSLFALVLTLILSVSFLQIAIPKPNLLARSCKAPKNSVPIAGECEPPNVPKFKFKIYVGIQDYDNNLLIYNGSIFTGTSGIAYFKDNDYMDGLYRVKGKNLITLNYRTGGRDETKSNVNKVAILKDLLVFGTDNGYLYALTTSGKLLWSFKTAGEILGGPSIGDIDNDGSLEVIFGSNDKYVYCLSARTGKLKWKFRAEDRVTLSPAIGDVDGDRIPEVIIGDEYNYLYCLSGKNGRLKWKVRTFARNISAPAIGDIDSDGQVEVVLGSGYIFAVSGKDGRVKWKFKPEVDEISSIAIGDIDGDNELEVVAGTIQVRSDLNEVYAIAGRNGRLKWKVTTQSAISLTPVIGDIDLTRKLEEVEVIVGTWKNFKEIGARSLSLSTGFGEIGGWLKNGPAIGNLDNDDRIEMAIGGEDGYIYVYDFAGKLDQMIWPVFRGNPAGTGSTWDTYRWVRYQAEGKDTQWTPILVPTEEMLRWKKPGDVRGI